MDCKRGGLYKTSKSIEETSVKPWRFVSIEIENTKNRHSENFKKQDPLTRRKYLQQKKQKLKMVTDGVSHRPPNSAYTKVFVFDERS